MKAAIYARYSTAMQSEQSIADQLRVCTRLAERHGFGVVAEFGDAAISGGTTARPSYQRMLAAARRREFDVIVAEDTSRLWRNLSEQAPRIAELRDLGVHVVTHDLDTRQESAAVLGAVLGAMGETYRQEIGRRTRRGLEGRARAGKSAGGRAYGYTPGAQSGTGQVEVDPEQAAVVRRIFELYRDGNSARAIAETLNAERVPSPGATWNRTERRRAGWLSTAIAGDVTRGTGILNNAMYRGVVIWNRHRWIRSATDSKRRRCVQNPESEWITHTDPRLRIVPEELWEAAKARQQRQSQAIGERISTGMARKKAQRTGAGPKFLLSGLIRCGDCGAAYVMASVSSYACASYVNGGRSACSNDARFRRDAAERVILEGIRRELATPVNVEKVLWRVRAKLREVSRPKPLPTARIAQLESQVANLIDAVAAGGLRHSTGLGDRLRAAEAELLELRSIGLAAGVGQVEQLLPDLARRLAQRLERLPEVLAGDVARARTALAEHIGPLTVKPTAREIQFYRDKGHLEGALLRAAGSSANLFGSGGPVWTHDRSLKAG